MDWTKSWDCFGLARTGLSWINQTILSFLHFFLFSPFLLPFLPSPSFFFFSLSFLPVLLFSSQPVLIFLWSPPSSASKPVIQDEQFGNNSKMAPFFPALPSSLSTLNGWCVRMKTI
ncbi:hypothetical protein PRUPE_3G161400 [Prunus persica]|uniref:Uncharacterized protein n=1 Tax=Prunus persica TaxID=3760 RepID=A0A251Q100_PRUPE|nr:hypothetical protein PRUPE_3G161400 [Prunus persica]